MTEMPDYEKLVEKRYDELLKIASQNTQKVVEQELQKIIEALCKLKEELVPKFPEPKALRAVWDLGKYISVTQIMLELVKQGAPPLTALEGLKQSMKINSEGN